MITYLTYDTSNGTVIGNGLSADGTLPSNAIECSPDQAANYQSYSVSGGQIVSAPTSQLLAQSKAAQIAALTAAYGASIQQPVGYTSKGGVTKTYQVDPGSIENLSQMLLAFQASGTVPTGFYWISLDDAQVPFTYADMQGLAQAMGAQGAAAFQKLQTLKGQVSAATTVSAVNAITWS